MDTIREIAYAMREQAAEAHQIMDQQGDDLRLAMGEIRMAREWTWNLLNSKRGTCLVLEEHLNGQGFLCLGLYGSPEDGLYHLSARSRHRVLVKLCKEVIGSIPDKGHLEYI